MKAYDKNDMRKQMFDIIPKVGNTNTDNNNTTNNST